MDPTIVLLVAAIVSLALTPVLTGYRGLLKGKLEGFGFNAEIVVDSRSGSDEDKEE